MITKVRICSSAAVFIFLFTLLLSAPFGAIPESQAGNPPAPSPAPAATAPAPSPAASSDSERTTVTSPAETPQISPTLAPSLQEPQTPAESPKADKELTPLEAVIQKMKMVNKGLKDYSSDVKVTGMGRYSILDIPLYVEGVYYYKEPDKHRLKVNRGPHYLSQYPQAFGWSLPDPDDWTCKVKEISENGTTYIILKLIPIMGMGDLQKVEMWIDKSSYLFGKQIYFYRDGGKMTLDTSYRTVNGYSLFNKLVGHFEFPKKHIKADAEVEYGEYRINQGIDDSVFQDTKKK